MTMQEYYKQNKDRIRANARAYYAEHAAKILEQRKEQKQEISIKNKTYYRLHKEEIKDKLQLKKAIVMHHLGASQLALIHYLNLINDYFKFQYVHIKAYLLNVYFIILNSQIL